MTSYSFICDFELIIQLLKAFWSICHLVKEDFLGYSSAKGLFSPLLDLQASTPSSYHAAPLQSLK